MNRHDETQYIINEIRHLDWCGMKPHEIANALKRNQKSLSKLLYRHNEQELGMKFARVPFSDAA